MNDIGIRRYSLLSTTALLNLFGINGNQGTRLEPARWTLLSTLHNPEYETATLRDQRPISDAGLHRCLASGLIPREGCEGPKMKEFF